MGWQAYGNGGGGGGGQGAAPACPSGAAGWRLGCGALPTAELRRGYGGAAPRLRRGCRKGRGPAGRRFRRARRAVQAASCTSALRPVTSVWPQTWLGLGLGLGLGDGRLATDRPGDERRRRVWNPEPVTLAEAAARASGYPRALSGAAAPPECGAPRRALSAPRRPEPTISPRSRTHPELPGTWALLGKRAARACARPRQCSRRRARPCRS